MTPNRCQEISAEPRKAGNKLLTLAATKDNSEYRYFIKPVF